MRVLVRAPLEDIDEHGVGGSIKREFTVTTKTYVIRIIRTTGTAGLAFA